MIYHIACRYSSFAFWVCSRRGSDVPSHDQWKSVRARVRHPWLPADVGCLSRTRHGERRVGESSEGTDASHAAADGGAEAGGSSAAARTADRAWIERTFETT